jgi:hypothetical protein
VLQIPPPEVDTIPAGIEDPASYLQVPSFAKTELFLTQHLFANFMWSVAEFVSPTELSRSTATLCPDFSIRDFCGWLGCNIESETLSALMSDIQKHATGLGDEDTITNMIMPALSWHDLLPYHSLAGLIVNFPLLVSKTKWDVYDTADELLENCLIVVNHSPLDKFTCTMLATIQNARTDGLLLFAPGHTTSSSQPLEWMMTWAENKRRPMGKKELKDFLVALEQLEVLYR